MNTFHRRHVLTAAAALGWLGLAPASALALDLAELNKAPELGDMALGAADAKVTVIEYASATCPHCAKFHKDVFPLLKAQYIDTNKIRFVFREYPLNDAALAAFMLARSASKEAYFPMIDVLFGTLEVWGQNPAEGLLNIAKQAGFTQDQFDAVLKDEALAKKILAIRADGEKFGVDGTPCFFVNGEKMSGEQSIEALKAKIDPLLN
jgi:protein-disulfide isomerase